MKIYLFQGLFFVVLSSLILFGCRGLGNQSCDDIDITKNTNPYMPDYSSPDLELNGYHLVFNDEFNHEGPMKEEYWDSENGFKRNFENQWYQSQNGICTNGRLIITAKRERVVNLNYEEGSSDWKKNREFAEYTSASFITKEKYHQKYDSIMMIMRAKLPLLDAGSQDYGVWPAFWTTGSGAWPDGGEIDIMEYYNGQMMANFAFKGDEGAEWKSNIQDKSLNGYVKNIINGNAYGFNYDNDWLNKYHIWKLVGNGKWLTVYLDDVFMSRILLDIKNKDTSKLEYPFKGNKCNYWINLAVGGIVHKDNELLSLTKFPRHYEIDYARIYYMEN